MLTNKDVLVARTRLINMHFESQVGHLGGNLSCLDALLVVLHEFVGDDDRFVLSKGHSAGALYIALWSKGLISDGELSTFHKDDTRLPGHPPTDKFEQIPFATGSLGHGLSLAAGLAMSKKLKGASGRVFCLTSDGEWQEGSTWEALIFACHNQLENLTILVDHNELQGFGTTAEVASMSPLWARLSGFDLQVKVIDGHNISAIRESLSPVAHRPSVVMLKTIKGYGVPAFENRMDSHYIPIKQEQVTEALNHLGVK